MRLIDLVPDSDVLIALAPEQLGRLLMKLAKANQQNGAFVPSSLTSQDLQESWTSAAPYVQSYQRHDVELALAEAWHWLELNMLIMPQPGVNGNNGWRVFTRRGQNLANDDSAFESYARGSAFPRQLLHPTLGNDVWLELAQGKWADAVFKSFRAVEEAVRSAGSFLPTDVGVDLMRRAFNTKTGPLSNPKDPVAEREALSNLFAGAIGSYKNPHSHRTVTISDLTEAQEMVLLASHLLRIVDDRRAKLGQPL